ncbi:hypothetical protein BC941DRAFT_470263 [Chlamydoabsidia padenii]|nr:hypothetical protein BC941DRAFT_470263 [Chlamydoabsidia padenii]
MDPKLKDFVKDQVTTYCDDADPEILSNYVLALVNNDTKPTAEIKSSLHEQLQEFFENETTGFIDRLYQFMDDLNTKGKQPSSTLPATANHFKDDDEDDEEDGDRSFKHRRPRYEQDDTAEDNHKRRLSDDPEDDGGHNKFRRTNRPHRDDPKANDIPSGPAAAAARKGYQPAQQQNRNGRNRPSKPMCRDYNEKGYCVRGDLCPYEHGKDTIVYDEANVPFNNSANPMMPMMPPPPFFDMPNIFGKDAFTPENMAMMQSMMAALPPMPNPEEVFNNMMPPQFNRGGGPIRRGRGTGIRGRGGPRGGRGGNYGDRYNNRPRQQQQQQSNTLVIDNIPPEHCQMTTINDYFKKFGSITNISLQPQKAFVQFSTHEEAEAAHQSPDAIFDNRFVKVYWHKEGDHHEGDIKQERTWTADRPATTNVNNNNTNEPDPAQVAAKAAELQKLKEEKLKKRQEQMQGLLELQKQKEQLLQRQIGQQKQLLAKLSDKSLTLAQKEELLKSLKKIAADIDQSNKPVIQPENNNNNNNNDSTDYLKEKLAKLKAEAASLGISPDSVNQPGGYYNRWQPRGNMKRSLDNRPTKVMIKDIPQESNEDDVKKYFEQFGRVVSFENAQDGGVIAHYSQRFEAEKAMALGPNYPTGKLALSWYTDNTSV